MTRLLPFSALSALLVSCATGSDADRTADRAAPTTEVTDSAGVQIVTIQGAQDDLPVWRLEREPRYTISGATIGDSTALSRVGDIRWLESGGLVVHDPEESRLLVFEADGRFARAHGRDGSGPGELQWLSTLAVQRGDTITTWDRELRRLSFWHPVSGYARQLTVNESDDDTRFALDAWAWQDSLVVVLDYRIPPRPTPPAGRTVVRWPSFLQLVLRDARGRTLATSPEFEGSPSALDRRGDSPLPFANLPFVALGSAAAYFGSGVDFTVGQLSPAFAVAGSLRWPAAREPLASAEVERIHTAMVDVAVARLPPERARPDRVREAFAYLFELEMLPAHRPALRRALVDDADRLWLERFEPRIPGTRRQPIASRWTVLAADGTPLAALALPPDTRLEDVRDGRAVVVHRDADDMESVAVYRLDTARP